jgi:hypothetical protein
VPLFLAVVDFRLMKIIDKIKGLFRRRPLTEEELAARAEAETIRQQAQEQVAEFAARDRAQGGPF